eukprot:2780080-Amphidinium_carterae.1
MGQEHEGGRKATPQVEMGRQSMQQEDADADLDAATETSGVVSSKTMANRRRKEKKKARKQEVLRSLYREHFHRKSASWCTERSFSELKSRQGHLNPQMLDEH